MTSAATLDSTGILERLVAFPTVSHHANIPLIDWVRNFLADYKVDSNLVFDAEGTKANLYATIGPADEGGVVLSGHTDVVPIEGQTWSSDPFELTRREERLYARGACDMKGFIATTLGRVATWRRLPLVKPIHLMFSYDEEVGCLGAPGMIAAAKATLPTPAVVVVGEPTRMLVGNEHKGICTVRTRVRGIEAHSSLTHQGMSAVMLAGELIARLGELAQQLQTQAPESASGSCFEPPYSSLSVNQIRGGTAINILAAACEFTWDIRTLPGETIRPILQRFSSVVEARLAELASRGKPCSVDTEVVADVPALANEGGLAETSAHAAALSDGASIRLPFATEAGQFQQAGWSVIVCGPGSIEQAHKADEYIETSQLTQCEAFLNRLIARQCL